MAEYLVLSAKDAEAVRGETKEGHELNPIALTDGSFILPLSVLDDPAHENVKGYLEKNALVGEVDPSLFPVRQSRRPQK